MKYSKFMEMREEFPEWGDSLAYEMCCGFTGDSRYCNHLIRHPQYASHECKLKLNPIDMEDWICPNHTLREKPQEVIEEKPKKQEPPDISLWFDIDY